MVAIRRIEHRIRGSLLASLVLFLSTLASACGGSSSEHYQKALEIEQGLLARGGDITYADPGYLAVARELEKVRPWAEEYDQARSLLQKIQDARRIRLNEVRYLDYLPDRLEGVSLASLVPPGRKRDTPTTHAATRTPVPASEAGTSAPRDQAAVPESRETHNEDRGKAPKQGTTSARSGEQVPDGHGGGQSVASRAKRGPPVTLYMTSWCPYCRKTAAYLKARGIQFVAKDIEKDAQAAQEVARKARGYGGVPVVDIAGTIIRGYDPVQIDAALAQWRRSQSEE